MSAAKLKEAFTRFNAGDLAGAERLCAEVLVRERGNADALHLQGIIHMVGGKAEEAVGLLRRAAELSPGNAALLENLGVAHLAAGRPVEAEAALRRALKSGASSGLLHMRLGLALGAQGRLDEALGFLRAAAQKLPDDADVQVNLGNALAEKGELDAAVWCYAKVLARHPAHIDTRLNLGAVYKRMGKAEDAEQCFRAVLAQAPRNADAHTQLGLMHAARGAMDEAIACYRTALESAPGQPQALNNLGSALAARGDEAEAEACYMRALAAAPNDADARINLGNLRLEQGRWDEARALYEQAVDSPTAGVDALCNLGTVLRRQGQHAQALTCFRRALERAPARADCVTNIAATYLQSGDVVRAEEWYRKVLAIDAQNATAIRELADVLKVSGKYDEAALQYERALAFNSDDFAALGGLIYVRQHLCDWNGIETLWGRARRDAVGKAAAGITPFSFLAQPNTPAEQLACARAWVQAELAPFVAQRARLGFDFAARKTRPAKLRIGYLSWDLHQHATAYLIAELFELHDRQRFEIFAYSYGPDDGSAIRARMRAAADGFIDVEKNSHTEAARAIHENRIDILVDLKGYTQGARPQILALQPAPVQVNWLGYPGTMGLEPVDAIIADTCVIPQGAESGYSERVVRLPDCYQINDRRRQVGARPERGECGLPADGFVFCCFNQSYKILPDVFAAWMRILQAVPGSVLWLLETNRWAVENLRRAAATHGVDAGRLVFAPIRPLADHLGRYCAADLALDTFPYTSHTTGSDALWAGCPLVTCVGETFASRVAGSLLRAAGLPELITDSLPDCEQLAIELARTPSRLAELRARLAANRDTCALFDSPRFVRNLEKAYDRLWEDWAATGITE